jgi:hypothetical protein
MEDIDGGQVRDGHSRPNIVWWGGNILSNSWLGVGEVCVAHETITKWDGKHWNLVKQNENKKGHGFQA